MSRVANRWSEETVLWVMSLKGTMAEREAEAETGVPKATIHGWWSGSAQPRCYSQKGQRSGKKWTHCKNGHPLVGKNIYLNTSGNDGYVRRQCRKCRLKIDRVGAWKRRGRFHPTHNPDISVAPVNKLWLPAAEVAEFIQAYRSMQDIWQQFGYRSNNVTRFYRWKRGTFYWARYDVADRVCSELGLALSMSGIEPVYSGVPPARPDHAEEVNAA